MPFCFVDREGDKYTTAVAAGREFSISGQSSQHLERASPGNRSQLLCKSLSSSCWLLGWLAFGG
jgi:hypothetical protein